MSVPIEAVLHAEKCQRAERTLFDCFNLAIQPASALAVWLDRPGIVLAAYAGWIWTILEDLEPDRLEQCLSAIERTDDGQSPAMIRNQNAFTAWIRSERDLRLCPQWQAMIRDWVEPAEPAKGEFATKGGPQS